MRQSSLAAIFAGLFLLVGVSACGGDECGDSICGESEDRESCPQDCAVCGDGFCDSGENLTECPEDCFDACSLEVIGLGEQCMANSECGDGGSCLKLEGDAFWRCYQICIPGGCEGGDLCQSGEVCVGIIDNGVSRLHPDGRDFGVCYDAPEGDQGAYQPCGGTEGNCQTDMGCVSVNDANGSFCSPICGGGVTCPAASNDMAGSCMLVSGSGAADHCALSCSQANPCPAGMDCVDLGGAQLCLWP